VIANLLYVMDNLDQGCGDGKNGKMGFIANMNDWTTDNFDYCLQFMEALQGYKGPVKVDLFLIVNPPIWFDTVWQIMKPMLASSFRRKAHMIPESKLKDFFKPGFERYLPNELKETGRLCVPELVAD
jgi:hypothetical protein